MEYFQPGKLSRKKTALVLSGGGSRGAFEIGVLKVLLSYITPHVIIGTSVGAANGAMAAIGMSPHDMEKIWLPLKTKDVFSYNWELFYKFIYAESVYSGKQWQELVETIVGEKRFEDCVIPFYVNTTRLNDGKSVFFESGKLVDAIMASSATPLLFPAHEINGVKYIDGGVGAYLGVEKVKSLNCKQIIVVNLGVPAHYEKQSRNLLYNAMYALGLLTYQGIKNTMTTIKDLNIVTIELHRYNHLSMIDFSMTRELIAEGEREAKLSIDRIKL